MLPVGSFGWKEIRVFRIKCNFVMEVVESITWFIFEWASLRKEFHGVFVKDFNRSLSSFLKGGWSVKSRVRVIWGIPLVVF